MPNLAVLLAQCQRPVHNRWLNEKFRPLFECKMSQGYVLVLGRVLPLLIARDGGVVKSLMHQ